MLPAVDSARTGAKTGFRPALAHDDVGEQDGPADTSTPVHPPAQPAARQHQVQDGDDEHAASIQARRRLFNTIA